MRPTRLLAVLLTLSASLVGTAPAATAAVPTSAATTLDLPAPTGRLAVGVTDLHLTDPSRPDPWAPTPAARELMVRAWYPAIAVTPRARYADEATSATVAAFLNNVIGGGVSPFLDRVRPQARQNAPVFGAGWPVLLYSQGRGSMRALSTSLAEDLASHGYVVLSVDHTYDAGAVRFPDGRVIRGNRPQVPTEAQRAEELRVRVADLRSTLNHVSTAATPFRGRLDLSRVGTLGHSMGGATAAEAIRTDPRFRAGVNLDGGFWDGAANNGVPAPFLLLSTGAPDYPTFTAWKASHRSWGRHFALTGAAHYSATDLTQFADLSGARELLRDRPALYTTLFGDTPGSRTTQLNRVYTQAFFQQHLYGVPNPLLDAPSPAYPEQTLRWSHS
ncbi:MULTISPECIES: hydrolase [unclassified Crossiella]|uniref:alpha/beta hydrolase family protein n=1 Tax=unclassified Crossiella TaxID=2620835 RepID=UPI00200053E6|nr:MULTISPECIES: hydrolase [unclassified Crossiella]MCK2243839.1 hydrolase [Crossiella sp. S99.2]MCK2257698.1 hydrolase [Crossiella sp. S99.1]